MDPINQKKPSSSFQNVLFPSKSFLISSREGEREIFITPTGWGNVKDFVVSKENSFIVSYSLHSNFSEIEMFVKSICPSILKPLVAQKITMEKEKSLISAAGYLASLMNLKQRGTEILARQYARPEQLSEEYRQWMDPKKKAELNKELGLFRETESESGSNEAEFKKANPQVFKTKTNQQRKFKGVKLTPIEKNNCLSTDDYLLVKRLREIDNDPIRGFGFDSGVLNEVTREFNYGGNAFGTDFIKETRKDQNGEYYNGVLLNGQERFDGVLDGFGGFSANEESNGLAYNNANHHHEINQRSISANLECFQEETPFETGNGEFVGFSLFEGAPQTLPIDETLNEKSGSVFSEQTASSATNSRSFVPIDVDFHDDFMKKEGFYKGIPTKKNNQVFERPKNEQVAPPPAKRINDQSSKLHDGLMSFKRQLMIPVSREEKCVIQEKGVDMESFFDDFLSESIL